MDFIVIVFASAAILASLTIGLILLSKQRREEKIWNVINNPPPSGMTNEREYHRWMIEATVMRTALTRNLPKYAVEAEIDEWLSLNQDGGMPLQRVLQYIRIGLTPKMCLESPYKEMPDEALAVFEALAKSTSNQ